MQNFHYLCGCIDVKLIDKDEQGPMGLSPVHKVFFFKIAIFMYILKLHYIIEYKNKFLTLYQCTGKMLQKILFKKRKEHRFTFDFCSPVWLCFSMMARTLTLPELDSS